MRRWKKAVQVPLPPVPSDPMVCRWCGGPKVQMSARAACQAGCTEQPLSGERTCEDCGGRFETGERFPGDQCWQCRDEQLGRARGDASRRVTGWLKDKRVEGAINRDHRTGQLPDGPALDLSEKR